MAEDQKHILAILVFALATVIFFRWTLSGTQTFVTTGLIHSDLMGYSYPVKEFYSLSLRKGTLPLWSKDIASGLPLFAEGQVGALYPLNFLFFRYFPMPLAFNLCLSFHFFLACLSTYLLLREGLGCSFGAGILAGLCFGFSGFLTTHLVHFSMIEVAAFLPLVVLFLIRQFGRSSWSNFFCLALIFSLQILAGHVELLFLSLVVLGIFCLFIAMFRYQKEGLAAFVPVLTLGGSLAISFLLTSIQVLPSLELTHLSSRSEGLSFENAVFYLFPLSHLAHFVFPDRADFTAPVVYESGIGAVSSWETYGYIGLVPLFLAILAVSCLIKRNRNVRFFSALLLISLLFALGKSTPFFEILWRLVPLMSLFKHPTRILALTELALAVLAGCGLDLIRRKLLRRGLKKITWVIILLIVVVFAFLDLYRSNSFVNATASSSWWFGNSASVQFLESRLGSDYRFGTLGTSSFDYRLTEDLAIQKELQNLLPPDFNLVYRLPSTEGLLGLPVERHARLSDVTTQAAVWTGDKASLSTSDYFVRLSAIRGTKFLLSDLELSHPRLKLIDHWPFSRPLFRNVYVSSRSGELFIGERVSVLGVNVYENLDVLPRACFVPEAVVVESGQAVLETLQSSEFDITKTVVLETEGDQHNYSSNSALDISSDSLESSAEIAVDKDQEVIIKVSTPNDGYLVLSDTYYPGWKAYVSALKEPNQLEIGSNVLGNEVEILRANYNFRAIPLSQGEYIVTFRYEPESFKRGLALSTISLGILVGLGVYWRLRCKGR